MSKEAECLANPVVIRRSRNRSRGNVPTDKPRLSRARSRRVSLPLMSIYTGILPWVRSPSRALFFPVLCDGAVQRDCRSPRLVLWIARDPVMSSALGFRHLSVSRRSQE